MFRKALFLVGFLLLATPASALTNATVTTVLAYEGHNGILVRLNDLGSHPNPSGCARSDYYILVYGHVHFQQIYAMLLTAASTKRPVDVGVSGCHESMPRIAHFSLV